MLLTIPQMPLWAMERRQAAQRTLQDQVAVAAVIRCTETGAMAVLALQVLLALTAQATAVAAVVVETKMTPHLVMAAPAPMDTLLLRSLSKHETLGFN
jgi:hypothetical protein